MAVTQQFLVELISDTEASLRAKESKLREHEELIAALNQEVQELRDEAKSARSMLARRFPDAADHIDDPVTELTVTEPVYRSLWTQMPRVAAVEKAIREIYVQTRDTVSPGQIEDLLSRNGRSDSRDDIGGATARLNKTGRIHSVGRGRWLPGPPTQTSGDTVGAVDAPVGTEVTEANTP